MAYQVFSRKYRPQTFNDLIGQPHIKETLMNAINSNRLAHAYLFTGSRGTGKTTTARILAKCLNCLKGTSHTPCNECSSCKEIANGSSLDVIEIDGASNRGIDEIRELRERVKFLPANAKYKVYIIDEVHMLTTEAFNALLKTLEEPPAHVIFVFATTEPHKVPQTILSRCQRFDFKRIPLSEICKLLQKVSAQEKIEIDDLTLTLIARASEGSMRDAESILDQVVSYCGNKVTQEDVLTLLGIVRQEILINFCEAIGNADANKIIKLLNDLIDEGIDLIQFVREMMIHLRNLLLIKVGCSPESVIDLSADSIKLLSVQSLQWTEERLLSTIDELQKANENMRLFPLQARLILEITLIKIIQGDKKQEPIVASLKKEETIVTPPQPIEQTRKISAQEQGQILPVPIAEPCSEQGIGLSIQQIKEIWPQLRQNIKKEKPSLESWLVGGELLDLTNYTLTIGFKKGNSFYREGIEKREHKESIEAQIKGLLNCNLRIKTVLINGESEETNANPKILDRVMKIFPEAEVICRRQGTEDRGQILR